MQAKLGEFVIVAGVATKDAKFQRVGDKKTSMCTFSLAVGKNKDTTTIYANCKAWRKLADYSSIIKKGDSVCVIGSIEESEYNGKSYKTLVADWLNVAAESFSYGSDFPSLPPPPNCEDEEELPL